MNLFRETQRGVAKGVEEDGRWLFFESAIVAENEDPERRHRIKVIIPSIDENFIFDDWVRAASEVCLGNNFGSVFIPEKGSEVLVTGVLGQKYNLVYTGAVYNEEMAIASELGLDTPGLKMPKNLSFIAGLLAKIQAQNIQLIAEQLAKTTGQNIESIAQQLNKMTGQNIQSIAGSENKVSGQTLKLEGTTIQVNSNGTVTITATGAIQITGTSIKLFQRTVNPVGPAI